MSYQVGQAFITEFNDLGFITGDTKTTYNYVMLRFSDCRFSIGKRKIDRPATEAEILAEAVKHGFYYDYLNNFNSPKGHCVLTKAGEWYLANVPMIKPSTENLKEYCEEGLITHRLITALNLAK